MGAIVVVVVVVVLIVVLSSGSSSKHTSSATAAAGGTSTHSSTSPAATGAGTTTGTTSGTTSTTGAKIIGQINMNPPSGAGGSAKGVAFIVQASSALGVIIQAQGLAPNSHNAYAVWLSNSPSDSKRVGFVNQAVGKNGRLQTGGQLPTNATHYKDLLLTIETQNNPTTPGPVVLQGSFVGSVK